MHPTIAGSAIRTQEWVITIQISEGNINHIGAGILCGPVTSESVLLWVQSDINDGFIGSHYHSFRGWGLPAGSCHGRALWKREDSSPREVEMAVWMREELKMFINIPESWSAQSLSTCWNVVWASSFAWRNPLLDPSYFGVMLRGWSLHGGVSLVLGGALAQEATDLLHSASLYWLFKK